MMMIDGGDDGDDGDVDEEHYYVEWSSSSY